MGMKEVKEEVSKIAKSAWIPTQEFVEILAEQKGKDIKLQEIGKRANYVKLIDVTRGEATYESLGKIEKLPISRINCFTTHDEWWCQKKH